MIGQDSQQVLLKHGGTYIRVHPCRLLLERKYLSEEIAPSSSVEVNVDQNPLKGNSDNNPDVFSSEDENNEAARIENLENVSTSGDEEEWHDSAGNSAKNYSDPNDEAEDPVTLGESREESIVGPSAHENSITLKKNMKVEYLNPDNSE